MREKPKRPEKGPLQRIPTRKLVASIRQDLRRKLKALESSKPKQH